MKNLSIPIITLFMSFTGISQHFEATLLLKDGDSLVGFCNFSRAGKKVFYKKDRQSQTITYHFSKVSKLKMNVNGSLINYAIVSLKKKSKLNILEEVINGKRVSLYKVSHTVDQGGSGVGNLKNLNTLGQESTYSRYFLKKESEGFAIPIMSNSLFSRNFKKTVSKYFQDCNSLQKKIDNREFGRDEIEQIVNYYNDKCL